MEGEFMSTRDRLFACGLVLGGCVAAICLFQCSWLILAALFAAMSIRSNPCLGVFAAVSWLSVAAWVLIHRIEFGTDTTTFYVAFLAGFLVTNFYFACASLLSLMKSLYLI